jgi:hypothetical protein
MAVFRHKPAQKPVNWGIIPLTPMLSHGIPEYPIGGQSHRGMCLTERR